MKHDASYSRHQTLAKWQALCLFVLVLSIMGAVTAQAQERGMTGISGLSHGEKKKPMAFPTVKDEMRIAHEQEEKSTPRSQEVSSRDCSALLERLMALTEFNKKLAEGRSQLETTIVELRRQNDELTEKNRRLANRSEQKYDRRPSVRMPGAYAQSPLAPEAPGPLVARPARGIPEARDQYLEWWLARARDYKVPPEFRN